MSCTFSTTRRAVDVYKRQLHDRLIALGQGEHQVGQFARHVLGRGQPALCLQRAQRPGDPFVLALRGDVVDALRRAACAVRQRQAASPCDLLQQLERCV